MQWIYLPLEAFIREQISLQVWSHLIATQAGYVKAKTMWNGFITNLSFLWPSGLSLTILFGWISCLSLTFFRYNKMSHPKSQNSTLFWFFFQTQVRFCTFKLSSSLNLSSLPPHSHCHLSSHAVMGPPYLTQFTLPLEPSVELRAPSCQCFPAGSPRSILSHSSPTDRLPKCELGVSDLSPCWMLFSFIS